MGSRQLLMIIFNLENFGWFLAFVMHLQCKSRSNISVRPHFNCKNRFLVYLDIFSAEIVNFLMEGKNFNKIGDLRERGSEFFNAMGGGCKFF